MGQKVVLATSAFEIIVTEIHTWKNSGAMVLCQWVKGSFPLLPWEIAVTGWERILGFTLEWVFTKCTVLMAGYWPGVEIDHASLKLSLFIDVWIVFSIINYVLM